MSATLPARNSRFIAAQCLRTDLLGDEPFGVIAMALESNLGPGETVQFFLEGPLFHLLSNRIYCGMIVHKGNAHPGEHEAIIEPELWDRVQAVIAENRITRSSRRNAQARTLLIEDKASGQQLIQTLRADQHTGVPWPIARTPEMDKYSRVAGVSAMIEAGQLLLPHAAPWLGEFVTELLAFPGGKFDHQVDALSQLLDWARLRMSHEPTIICGPIIFVCDDDGYVRSSEDADWDEFSGRLDSADPYF